MKTIYIIGLLVLVLSSAAALAFRSRWQKPSNPIGTNKMSFYDLTINSIDGKEMHMSDFKGKYVLCVNVASKCGYTPQYEGLQKLAEQYKDKLVVIGFPSNDFMHQEPGDAKEIRSFCTSRYGVTFPLAAKIDVKGKNMHPLYVWLTEKKYNHYSDNSVKWNFQKYLINEQGKLVGVFAPGMKPTNPEIISAIEK